MAMDVQLGNPVSDTAHSVAEVREVLFEAFFNIFLILAIDVVSMIDLLDPWVKP
jgi:hypothetical protein